jgi:hypothetical protein
LVGWLVFSGGGGWTQQKKTATTTYNNQTNISSSSKTTTIQLHTKNQKQKLDETGKKRRKSGQSTEKQNTKNGKAEQKRSEHGGLFFSLAHKSSVFFFLKKEKGVSKRLSYFIVGFKSVQANGNGLLFAREQEKNHSVSSFFFSVFPVLFFLFVTFAFFFFSR